MRARVHMRVLTYKFLSYNLIFSHNSAFFYLSQHLTDIDIERMFLAFSGYSVGSSTRILCATLSGFHGQDSI